MPSGEREVAAASLASRVDASPHTRVRGVGTHRHQAKPAGMTEPSIDTGPLGSLSKASVSFRILTSSLSKATEKQKEDGLKKQADQTEGPNGSGLGRGGGVCTLSS